MKGGIASPNMNFPVPSSHLHKYVGSIRQELTPFRKTDSKGFNIYTHTHADADC